MKKLFVIALLALTACSNSKSDVINTASCQLQANDTSFTVEFKTQNNKIIEVINEVVIPKHALEGVDLTTPNFNEEVTNELYDYVGVSYSLVISDDEATYYHEKVTIDTLEADIPTLVGASIIDAKLTEGDPLTVLSPDKAYAHYESIGYVCVK